MLHRRNHFPYVWRAVALGLIFITGIIFSFNTSPSYRPFGIYVSVLAFFHLSEFLTIALIKPRSLKIDSFLLNHSPEYHIALVASCIEFFVEAFLFPSVKSCHWITTIGLMTCIAGESIRKTAMFTAGSNFNHTVEYRKERSHQLVTRGVYAIWRHPSYAGWFYWSIGTQLMLINPICLIGYACAAFHFFKHRIRDEEVILIEFFGEDYVEYRKKVPCGIPFLSIESNDDA